jgi:hypothetical protein
VVAAVVISSTAFLEEDLTCRRLDIVLLGAGEDKLEDWQQRVGGVCFEFILRHKMFTRLHHPDVES